MKKFFYLVNDQQMGPLSIEELKKENISRTTLVWAEGMAEWKPASDVTDFKGMFATPPPPPPRKPAPPPPPKKPAPPPPPHVEQPHSQPPGSTTYAPQQPQGGYHPHAGQGDGNKSIPWLIIVGYIFAVLGGLIGLVIGVYLWQGRKVVNGEKVKRYDEKTQQQGVFIFILAIIMFVVWTRVF